MKSNENILSKYSNFNDSLQESHLYQLEEENAKLKKELETLKQKLEEKELALCEFRNGVPRTVTKPDKKYFINGKECSDKEFEKSLRYYHGIVNATVFFIDGSATQRNWNVRNFTQKSHLSGNIGRNFLAGWRDRGITGIRLEMNKSVDDNYIPAKATPENEGNQPAEKIDIRSTLKGFHY